MTVTAEPFGEHAPADHPVSLYGATKRSNELMAHSYSHLFELPANLLLYTTDLGAPPGRFEATAASSPACESTAACGAVGMPSSANRPSPRS